LECDVKDVRRASCVVWGVSYRYPDAAKDALRDVSFSVQAGEFHAVLGPNGSGKTTLVRIALGTLQPRAGSALIADKPAHEWSRQELARIVGVVPQREDNLFPQRVRETVLLGRYAHLSLWGSERPEDHDAVDRALAACDVAQLGDRWVWSLSGGEYQRVRVARALAQEPRLLVLDEPGMSLDLKHEMGLFELVRTLVDKQGLGVLMITHDLNLAARFADSLLLLRDGRPVASGAPADVLTQETVETVFSWPVEMRTMDDRPQMIPLRISQPHPSFPLSGTERGSGGEDKEPAA
jgi:iron complex transport system ATP-binding protein